MKGYRGVLVAFALSPLAAMAQVPVMEGSSNNGSNAVYQGSSVTQQTQAGLSSEGQLFQQLYQLQQEVTLLRGMLEEQSYKIKQMEQDQLDRYKDIDSRLSGMNTAPASGSSGASPDVADTQQPAANAGASAAPPDPEREKLMYDASFDLVKPRRPLPLSCAVTPTVSTRVMRNTGWAKCTWSSLTLSLPAAPLLR